MARERKRLGVWEGVKFYNFPLIFKKACKNMDICIFGGKYFSVTNPSWAGVVYEGKYKFYIPTGTTEEELREGVWGLRKMQETVDALNCKGEKIRITGEYFVIYPIQETEVKYYAGFIGGHYKYTLSGCGRDRNYSEYAVQDDAEIEVLATTKNRCRSGRFGSYASFIISDSPFEVVREGVY